MKRWLMFFAVMLLVVPLTMGMPAMTPAAAADSGIYLYGHDNNGSVIVMIDTSTGTIVPGEGGPTGFPSTVSGMATCRGIVEGPGDVLYKPGTMFALLSDGTDDWVVVVDPTTGVATEVVKTSRTIGGRGIAFGPDGTTLYLIEPGMFSIIDTENGAVTPVFPNANTGNSLEWDPDSELFYFISAGHLYNINLAGIVNPVGPTVPACTLVRSPIKMGGVWYTVSGGQLYTIDIETGAATLVDPGSGGLGQICGTAFAPERPRDIAPEQCKLTGGAEGEFEYHYYDEPEGDHRISFGFTATTTGSPCAKYAEDWGYIIRWPARGQFHLVNHTTGEKIRGTFERIVSEPPGFGFPGYRPNHRNASGWCTLDGEDYELNLEVTDNGEPGVKDIISIELFLGEDLVHRWGGTLDGGNLQLKCKGPEAELVKCPKPPK